MAGKAAFLEEMVLDWFFGLGAFAGLGLPDELGVGDYDYGLFKGDPEGAGVEVAGGSYARVAVAVGAAEYTRTGSVTHDNDIDFGTATADWATTPNPITHCAIYKGGDTDMLFAFELTAPFFVLNGQPFSFPAGTIVFDED